MAPTMPWLLPVLALGQVLAFVPAPTLSSSPPLQLRPVGWGQDDHGGSTVVCRKQPTWPGDGSSEERGTPTLYAKPSGERQATAKALGKKVGHDWVHRLEITTE